MLGVPEGLRQTHPQVRGDMPTLMGFHGRRPDIAFFADKTTPQQQQNEKEREPKTTYEVIEAIMPTVDQLTAGQGNINSVQFHETATGVKSTVDIEVDPQRNDPLNNPYNPQSPYPNKAQS